MTQPVKKISSDHLGQGVHQVVQPHQGLHRPGNLTQRYVTQLVRVPLEAAGSETRMVESLASMWQEEQVMH